MSAAAGSRARRFEALCQARWTILEPSVTGSSSMTRVAIVTGAARGIGAATVRTLATEGWAVLATDICTDDPVLPYGLDTRGELDAVVAEARSMAGDDGLVASVVADVRDRASLGGC